MFLLNVIFCMDVITQPVFYVISLFRRRNLIPPVDDDILHHSATVLAEKIRKKKLTCQQVVSAFVRRCRQVNPILNAIMDERFNDALRDARKVDLLLQNDEVNVSELRQKKPLLGIPITVKESCKVKGLKWTIGVKSLAARKAFSNSAAVDILVNAGAIPIAVTNVPPYCARLETSNSIIGYTLNPYDQNKSIGGSSGGEAALISSGASVVGLATDALGSIRIPCSFSGIYGHKPTKDTIISNDELNEVSALKDVVTVGPMCRYVEDLDLFMDVMSKGKHYTNSNSVDITSLKIYYLDEAKNEIFRTNAAVKERIVTATQYLHNVHNCQIEELNIEEMKNATYIYEAFNILQVRNLLLKLCKKCEQRKTFLGGIMGQMCKLTLKIFKINEENYLNMKNALRGRLNKILSSNALLLVPTYPEMVFHRGQGYFKGNKIMYCGLVNILNLTATTIPAGFDDSKMPIGIQVIGASGQDRLCIALAKSLNKCFGGWKPPYSLH